MKKPAATPIQPTRVFVRNCQVWSDVTWTVYIISKCGLGAEVEFERKNDSTLEVLKLYAVSRAEVAE